MSSKILAIGGVHGNEPLGIEIVRLLLERPIKGVDAIIANEKAVERDRRFIESDLNRSFGVSDVRTYEERLARKIQKKCEDYDIVLDFHNTQTEVNDCSFIGEAAPNRLISLSAELGLSRCIRASYDCINKYCLNTLSIEISMKGSLDSAEIWYQRIKSIVGGGSTGNSKPATEFRFVRRVTWKEKSLLGLNNWRAFTEISSKDKSKLGVDGIIKPIFVGSKLTSYYATLVKEEIANE